MPGVGDVGRSWRGVCLGGFVGLAEVDGAVDAGFGGLDAPDGEADAVVDDELEGKGGGDDGGEAVVKGGGEGAVAVVHAGGRMADEGRKGKKN